MLFSASLANNAARVARKDALSGRPKTQGVRFLNRRFGEKIILPAVALLVLVADQISKYLVLSNLNPGQSWNPVASLTPWVSITHVTNTGVAFGLFQDRGSLFVIIAMIVVAAIIFYYRHLPAGQWWIKVSLGLQLGGALGNLLDRLRLGYVVDFVDFKIWPVFNVADSSIVIGVAILAYYLLRDRDEKENGEHLMQEG
jgi:signal peptidase II